MFCRFVGQFRIAAYLKRMNLKLFHNPPNFSESLENTNLASNVNLKVKENLFRHPVTLPELNCRGECYISSKDICKEKNFYKVLLIFQFSSLN